MGSSDGYSQKCIKLVTFVIEKKLFFKYYINVNKAFFKGLGNLGLILILLQE